MSSSEEEQIYSIALTMVPGIGHIGAKHLIDGMNNAVDVFRLRKEIPERIPEVSQRVIEALDCPQAVIRAEQEYEFIRKNRISCLTFHDEAYPSRLRECEDAPIVLFFKGNTDLNSLHIINMANHTKKVLSNRKFRIRSMNIHTTVIFVVVICVIRICCHHWECTNKHHTLS